jgi:predicted dehydrogenase
LALVFQEFARRFDTLRYLGGDIAALSASAGRHSPVGAEVEDQWIVAVHFADGKNGAVVSSWTSPGTFNVKATGADAMMFYDIDQTHWAAPEKLHEHAALYLQQRGKGPADRKAMPVTAGNMYREELELFADSVTQNTPCELSAENGIHALAAVYAALKSAKEASRAVSLREVIEAAPR